MKTDLHLTASDIWRIGDLDATGQADLVRAGELTALDLTRAAIARIEWLDPQLGAVVTPLFERALETAAGPLTGPFAGVPFLLKDLAAELAGTRFTEGSRYLRYNVSTVDSELVRRYQAAGLVILGKTNTPEFGMLPTAEPELFGATRNPWSLGHTTGGSSGGSAAAVASGMVPFAHANDLGGSIRFPASCCGLFGLKPSRARVPLGPIYGDVLGGWAVEHALTRSVRDSAALLDAVAGPQLGDPYPAPALPGPLAGEVGRDPGRLRIGFSLRPPGGHTTHPDCERALREAVELCARLGHEPVEYDLPDLGEEVGAAIGAVYDAMAGWVVAYWAAELGREPQPGELEPLAWAAWERSGAVTAGRYLLAVTKLQQYARRVAAMFTEIDLWLTPTLAQPPLPLGAIRSTVDDPWSAYAASAPFTAFPAMLANLTGAPAMSVPLHWSPAGLPIGVHFLAPTGPETTLVRLAAQLEAAQPWADRRPDHLVKGDNREHAAA